MPDSIAPRDAPPPQTIRPDVDYVPAYQEQPAAWQYDIDPANGISRASYNGEVFIAGAAPVTSNSPAFTGNPTAPTQVPGDNDQSIATTAFVQTAATAAATAAVAPALNDVGRSLIHNGLFNVQQRGLGPFTTNFGYNADRWSINFGTDTMTINISPLSDAARSQIADESAVQCLSNNFTGNAAAGAYNTVFQKIEGVRRLAGKTVTLSFWAAPNAGNLKLGASLDQNFGTGGSPSAIVNNPGQSITTVAGTWARYSMTFTLPSAAGKTLGTNGDDNTTVYFWFSAGSTFNTRTGNVGVQSGIMNLWGVQLEIGSVATPLEKPDPQQELAKCQRFYARVDVYTVTVAAATGHSYAVCVGLPVEMRTIPAVAFTYNGNLNLSGVGFQVTRTNTVSIYGTATAGGTVTINCTFAATADL